MELFHVTSVSLTSRASVQYFACSSQLLERGALVWQLKRDDFAEGTGSGRWQWQTSDEVLGSIGLSPCLQQAAKQDKQPGCAQPCRKAQGGIVSMPTVSSPRALSGLPRYSSAGVSALWHLSAVRKEDSLPALNQQEHL